MKNNYLLHLLLLFFGVSGFSQAVTVNGTYNAPQLVNVLMDTPCVTTSNHSITGSGLTGGQNSVGYFQNTNPGFPMAAGVVLTSGYLNSVPGPAAPNSSDGASTWVGDTEIQAIVNAVPGFETDDSNNASKLEFDFIPLTNSMSFNFLFASEEYDGGSFECNYSDAFVFILTDLVTNAKTNLAVLPGTSTPILVTNVHPDNGMSCGGANPEFFGQYNGAGSAIRFDGQLVVMQASSPVIPGRQYHIKLAVSDLRDNSYDSAVFIGAGSFNVGQANLGNSLTLAEGTALCHGETRVLDTGLNPAQYTFVWTQDGAVMAGQTGPSITVSGPGTYAVTASNTGTSCSLSDDVTIEYYPEMVVLEPDNITECDNNGAAVDFDLSVNDDIVDQSIYYTTYYLTQQDALDELNQIGPIYSTLAALTTVWVKVKNFDNSCYVLKDFDLIIQDCGANPQMPADITLCENAPGSGQATFDFAALNNFVTNNQPGYTVTYHHNQTDADNDANAISPDNAYLGTNGEQIWVRMEDTADPTIDGVTSFHIYVLPLPTATISTSTPSVCLNTTGTVTFNGTPNATVTYNDGTANGTILLDAAGTATLTTPALTATAIYTLVDVATLGTPNCSQPLAGNATITVLPLPTATISGTTDVCQNAGAPNITFTGANGASPYTFTYTINNGTPQTVTTLAGNNTVTVAVPTAAVGGFVYDLVSVSSATTPSCSQSQTGSATVNVLALPTVAISTATPTICYNTTGSVTFTGTPNATVTYNDGTANQTAVLDATGSVTVVTPVLTADATYTLVDITSAGVPSCSQPQVGTATITVIALPTATISGTTTICEGNTAVVTFNGTPNATVTYNDGTANGTILLDATGTATLTTPALTATAIYTLVDVATLGTPNCSQPQVGTATITVLPLPTATISGTTDVCQNAGAPNITFTGANGASPYTFTYTINNGAPQTVTTLAGNNTVTVAVPTAAVGGFVYDLVSVSSATTPSCSQSQTGSATVNVLALPTVAISTATPTICYNTTGSVTFTGTPNATVTYNDGTANQIAVLDATGSVTVVTPVLTADATYTLVDITSAGVPSCSQPQVGTATITVIALPTATISGTTTICEGNTAVVTFNGTPNATVTYTVDTGADQTITLDGAGVATLTTPTLNASSVYTMVSVASATTPSCSQPQTGSASITVLPAPTVAISVTNATICNATTTGVIFTGTANATVSYSVNGNPAQTVVIGALGTTTINTGALTVDTTYTLIDITSAGTPSCTQTVNGSVTITVVPVPGVTALVTSASYCSGQAIGVQLSDPTPTNTTTTFSWTVAAVTGGVTGASAGNGPIISQVLTAGTVQGTVTYTVTPHIGSCTGPSQNVTVTVNPTPVLSVNPATLTQNVCSGNATSITLSSNIPGTVYYWTVNQSGATGASIANADTTGVINQTLTATGNQIGQVVYVITPYYNGCPGTPKTVTVTVNPEPTATFNATSQDLCSGETTDIELNSNVAGTTFTWTVLQTNVLGAVPGSGDTIAQTLTTVGFTAGTVTYTITPSVNGCPGDVITVTVNVNPRPDVIGSSGIPFCSGEPTNIILSSAFAGVEYHWTVVQNGVAGASDGSNTTGEIQQILTTTGDTNGTAVYTITPRLGNCDGASLTITVTVLALPNPKIEDGIVCVDSISGAVVNPYILDTELNPADYNFTWYEGSGATAVLIPGETGSTYTAIEAGVYTVHVVNQNTGCDFEKTVTVTETNPAQSATAVVSNYFAETQAITVTVIGGTGPFVYSLDGGEFQSSNVFPYVLPGEHTVVVQDEAHTGCTDITIYPIVTVSYPNFFTPNGDGINDTWNIWSIADQYNAEIHIFDRYGKLIKQITPAGDGWDGTFGGQILPSTDYWFTVKFDENGTEKLFKAHFSLKR